MAAGRNLDVATVEGFGDEWRRFDQSELPEDELRSTFEQYFAVFPWQDLPDGVVPGGLAHDGPRAAGDLALAEPREGGRDDRDRRGRLPAAGAARAAREPDRARRAPPAAL